MVRSGDVVHLWNTSLEYLAEAVCDRVWRNLTDDEWAKFIGTGANVAHVRQSSTWKLSAQAEGKRRARRAGFSRLHLVCKPLQSLTSVPHDRLAVADPDHADVEPGQAAQ